MKLAEIRQKYPQYSDLSDDQLAGAMHTRFYPDIDRKAFNDAIGFQQDPEASVWDRVKDTGIDAAKGVIGLGESAVGVADLVSGNLIGRGLARIGYDPQRSREILESGYSAERQIENEEVRAAEGFLDTVLASVQNPAVAVGTIVESSPMLLMSAGAVRAAATNMLAKRGLQIGSAEATAFLNSAPVRTRLAMIGSASEGAMAAGSNQEQARQAGRGFAESAPFSAAAGVGTAVIGQLASRVPGLGDIETSVGTAGMGSQTAQSIGRRIAAGMFQEGVLEELPQSAQEQIFNNLALGNEWNEGVPEAAATGLIAGAGMGGMARALETRSRPDEDKAPINRIFEAGDVDSVIAAASTATGPSPLRPVGDAIPFRTGTPAGSRMNAAGQFEVAPIDVASTPMPRETGFTNDQVDVVPFTPPGPIPSAPATTAPQMPAVDLPTRRFSTGEQRNPAMRLALQKALDERTIAALESAPQQEAEATYAQRYESEQAQKDADYLRALRQKADQDVAAAITPVAAESQPVPAQRAAATPAQITPPSSPTAPILRSNGKPFGSAEGAAVSAQFRANPGASVVPVEGGFGIQPKPVESAPLAPENATSTPVPASSGAETDNRPQNDAALAVRNGPAGAPAMNVGQADLQSADATLVAGTDQGYDESAALGDDGQYRYQFQANAEGGQTVGNKMRVVKNPDGTWTQHISVNGKPEQVFKTRGGLNDVLPSDEAVAKGWAIPVKSFDAPEALAHSRTADAPTKNPADTQQSLGQIESRATENIGNPLEIQSSAISETATKADTAPEPVSKPAAAAKPSILTASRNSYLKQMIRAAGIKKESPGYANAVARIESEYETELDKAYAALPFDQYNELNKDVPESINRQAYEQLQKEYGALSAPVQELTAAAKSLADAAKELTSAVKAQAEPKQEAAPVNDAARDNDTLASQEEADNTPATEPTPDIRRVEAYIAEPMKRLGQEFGADVVVLNSPEDMPGAGMSSNDGMIRFGNYSNGTVYLFAKNINSARTARRTLAHELIGHKGILEAATPEEWGGIKTTIDRLKMGNKSAKSIWAETERRYPDAPEEAKYKEFLAIAAERRELRTNMKSLFEKAKAMLRRILKSLGFNQVFSDSDIEIILSNSERYLRESGAEAQEDAAEGETVFSQSPQTDTPDTLFSQDTESDFQEENGKTDESLKTIADRVLAKPVRKTIVTRIQDAVEEHSEGSDVAIKQGALDQFASIADYEIKQYGQLQDASESAYKAAAFSKNSGTVLDAAMNYGALKYVNGGIEIAENTKGLVKIFEPLAEAGLVREWELWAAATRAKRLMAEGRENNFTRGEIDQVLSTITGKKLAVYQKIHSEWTTFNKRTLDFAEAAGLINAEERKLWERDDYVPFHRVSELSAEATQAGPRKRGGLSGQKSGITKLKGGVEKVSIIESMVRNTASLIDASMKNVAMQRTIKLADQAGAVEELNDARITDEEAEQRLKTAGIEYTADTLKAWKGLLAKYDARTGTVSVSVDGKPKRYLVHDPVLLRAISGLGPTGVEGIMKVLRIPKRLLTELITSDPGFSLRNLIRDTLSTWTVVHGINRNPLKDAIKGVVSAYKESDTLKAMRAQGVGGGSFYDTSPDGVRGHLERLSGDAGVATSLSELWQGYRRILGTTENANRIAIYEAAKKAGASNAEAAYQAMDILNFSRHGEWKAVRIIIELVPFMNARAQGLERLYRGAKEGTKEWHQFNKSFMIKGAMLTAATLALLAANWDEDDYWDLPEYERDTYYHFFVDGEHYRLPKPFEVGAIFSTIPERMFEQFRADADMKLLGKRMLAMVADTFAFDPTPQFVKPIVEVGRNRASFTGNKIVSGGMEYASPEAQYTPYTSKTFIEIADAMPDSAPAWMRSPVRLEHLFRGYLGTLGGYALMGSDFAAREIANSPVRPELRIQDVPIAQSFIRDGQGSNKQVSRVYDMSSAVNEIYSSIRKYREEGRADKVQELMNDNREMLRTRVAINRATNRMSEISSQIKQTYDHPAMTPAQKRARIDDLTRQRNEVAKAIEERYRAFY